MTQTVELRVVENRFPLLGRLDLKPSFARMSAYLDAEMDTMFQTAGASRGHPWQPLAPATLKRKRRQGRSTSILIGSTGRMRAAFEAIRIRDEELVYGIRDSLLPYPKYHDSDRPRTSSLPQRKLLRLIPRDIATFQRILRDDIERAAGGDAA